MSARSYLSGVKDLVCRFAGRFSGSHCKAVQSCCRGVQFNCQATSQVALGEGLRGNW